MGRLNQCCSPWKTCHRISCAWKLWMYMHFDNRLRNRHRRYRHEEAQRLLPCQQLWASGLLLHLLCVLRTWWGQNHRLPQGIFPHKNVKKVLDFGSTPTFIININLMKQIIFICPLSIVQRTIWTYIQPTFILHTFYLTERIPQDAFCIQFYISQLELKKKQFLYWQYVNPVVYS